MNDNEVEFHALQYALFTTCVVEIIGGFFFLVNAFYIVKDKKKVEMALKGELECAKKMLLFVSLFYFYKLESNGRETIESNDPPFEIQENGVFASN